jgi:plastocyanin
VTAPPSPDATVSPSPVATNVTMDTEASLPAVITVTAGTTVIWTDPSTEPHNVIAADNSFASLIL